MHKDRCLGQFFQLNMEENIHLTTNTVLNDVGAIINNLNI